MPAVHGGAEGGHACVLGAAVRLQPNQCLRGMVVQTVGICRPPWMCVVRLACCRRPAASAPTPAGQRNAEGGQPGCSACAAARKPLQTKQVALV